MAGIFPFLNPVVSQAAASKLDTFREYAWDFKNNCLQLVNGAPVVVEKNEALKVWMYKALTTPRYRYVGYSWNYGHELEGVIGTTFTPQAVQSEAERYVREALLVSPYIKSVPSVDVAMDGDELTISAQVETVYGEVSISV
jgi:hypothetical protein